MNLHLIHQTHPPSKQVVIWVQIMNHYSCVDSVSHSLVPCLHVRSIWNTPIYPPIHLIYIKRTLICAGLGTVSYKGKPYNRLQLSNFERNEVKKQGKKKCISVRLSYRCLCWSVGLSVRLLQNFIYLDTTEMT